LRDDQVRQIHPPDLARRPLGTRSQQRNRILGFDRARPVPTEAGPFVDDHAAPPPARILAADLTEVARGRAIKPQAILARSAGSDCPGTRSMTKVGTTENQVTRAAPARARQRQIEIDG